MPFDGKNKYFSGGRNPEGERLRKACRKVTDRVVQVWIDALEAVDAEGNPDHRIRMDAGNRLAERGYGKAAIEVVAQEENQIPLIPGTPEYDEMLLREWGFDRTGNASGTASEPKTGN